VANWSYDPKATFHVGSIQSNETGQFPFTPCARKKRRATQAVLREHSVLQIVPEKKLAFCRIPKVASAKFATMVGHDLNQDGWPHMIRPGVYDTFEKASPETLGIDPCTITKENNWTFAAFIRDPLQVYLSEFYSKCVMHNGTYEDDGRNCLGPLVNGSATIEEEVRMFEEQALLLANDPLLATRLGSFDALPQTYHLRGCFGDIPHASIDFIGVLTDYQSCNNAQLQEMLRMAGYNESFAAAASDSVFIPDTFGPDFHTYHSRDLYSRFYANSSASDAVDSAVAEDVQLYDKRFQAQDLGRCLAGASLRLGHTAVRERLGNLAA
jgi:hypothetical protein